MTVRRTLFGRRAPRDMAVLVAHAEGRHPGRVPGCRACDVRAELGSCRRCGGTGVEPGTVVVPPGHGSGLNSLDPDPLDRGSYVPCQAWCGSVPTFGPEERGAA